MSSFSPETIAPSVPLPMELEALLEFLAHQKPTHGAGDREFNEVARLSEKELDTKIRELENWNFRLNLDEARATNVDAVFVAAVSTAKETQDSISLGIVENDQPQPSASG